MSDDNHAGGQPQPPAPAPGGFDWLIEAHQQTSGAAPSADAAEMAAPPTLTFAAVPPPAVPPDPPVAASPLQAAPSQAAQAQGAPTQGAPVPPAPPAASPVQTGSTIDSLFITPPIGDAPASAAPLAGQPGPRALALERHEHQTRPTNGPLDWAALVLAIILPPIGLLSAIAAAVLGTRNRGYATSVAKAAIGIGAALTVVVIVASVVGVNLANQQAKHDAIAASSVAYCAKLKATPGTLASPTFGWPAPADTVQDTLAGMQTYEDNWTALEKLAPAGILAGTQKVAAAAQSIITAVQAAQVFDDATDVSQMQGAVSASGIQAWVSEYCS